MAGYNINIFISHSWAYSEHYDKLYSWIFEEGWHTEGIPLNFYNQSVPKDDPIHYARTDGELQAAIFKRIGASHVVIIPTGMYANYSKWIGKEIAGARDYSRKVLGVNPWAQERKSSVVQMNANEVVGWNKQTVVSAIWRLYNSYG